SLAAARTRIAPAVVSEARKVMIATTATSARPAMVEGGTIGVSKRGGGMAASAAEAALARAASSGALVSVVDMQPALVQHQTARVVLIHQRNVVGGDDHRGARL